MLTDNGIEFTNRARHKYACHHIFDRVCDENGIGHRLTRINHPRTSGQMKRTIREATVKCFHYDDYGHCAGTYRTSSIQITSPGD